MMGKKAKKYANSILKEIRFDLKDLKEKVYLKILEDCDDREQVSNETLVQTAMLFDEFSYDADQSRVVKEVY